MSQNMRKHTGGWVLVEAVFDEHRLPLMSSTEHGSTLLAIPYRQRQDAHSPETDVLDVMHHHRDVQLDTRRSIAAVGLHVRVKELEQVLLDVTTNGADQATKCKHFVMARQSGNGFPQPRGC
jgi:hypothetical protein